MAVVTCTKCNAVTEKAGFPTWAIIVVIVIVLAAIWWFMSQRETAEPAKTGMLEVPISFALSATPELRT